MFPPNSSLSPLTTRFPSTLVVDVKREGHAPPLRIDTFPSQGTKYVSSMHWSRDWHQEHPTWTQVEHEVCISHVGNRGQDNGSFVHSSQVEPDEGPRSSPSMHWRVLEQKIQPGVSMQDPQLAADCLLLRREGGKVVVRFANYADNNLNQAVLPWINPEVDAIIEYKQ